MFQEAITFIMDNSVLIAIVSAASAIGGAAITGTLNYFAKTKRSTRIVEQLPCEHKDLSIEHKELSNGHKELSGEHKALSGEHRALSDEHARIRENVLQIIATQEKQEAVRQESLRIKNQMPIESDVINKIQEVYFHNKNLLLQNEILSQQNKELSQQIEELTKKVEKLSHQLQTSQNERLPDAYER